MTSEKAFEITNPRRNGDGSVDVTWNHPEHGLIRFTAVDPEGRWGEPEYMKDIWDGLQRGDFGPITPAEEAD